MDTRQTKERKSVQVKISKREQQSKRLIHEFEKKEKEREKENYVDKKWAEFYLM